MTTKRNKQEIYDDVAGQWWSDEIRWVRTLKNLVPARFAFFDHHFEFSKQTVLDLGCAGGFMAEALYKKGAAVTGIDPAEQAIEAARAHADATGKDIKYDIGLGEYLPYERESFDAVVCVDVLEHVSDLARVLSEVQRVLKPGGAFLFDTINRTLAARIAVITVAEDILRLLPKGTHDPALFIKPVELRNGLRDSGLVCGPMTGIGPSGISLKGDFKFGVLPFKQVVYAGVARKPKVRK